MRNVSHTMIAAIKQAVVAWRKREDWSRETVTEQIVQFYYSRNVKLANVSFDTTTKDNITRQKNNADKLFRWLDDESKDNNLIPPNFAPWVIAALPLDLRIECVNEFMQPAELSVRAQVSEAVERLPMMLQSLAKEGGEALASMAGLLDGATPEELATARKEVTELLAAAEAALKVLEAAREGLE